MPVPEEPLRRQFFRFPSLNRPSPSPVPAEEPLRLTAYAGSKSPEVDEKSREVNNQMNLPEVNDNVDIA